MAHIASHGLQLACMLHYLQSYDHTLESYHNIGRSNQENAQHDFKYLIKSNRSLNKFILQIKYVGLKHV